MVGVEADDVLTRDREKLRFFSSIIYLIFLSFSNFSSVGNLQLEKKSGELSGDVVQEPFGCYRDIEDEDGMRCDLLRYKLRS